MTDSKARQRRLPVLSAWEGLQTTPQLGGIATDGTNLIVAGQGFVWLVSATGTIKHIAGSGERIDLVKAATIRRRRIRRSR